MSERADRERHDEDREESVDDERGAERTEESATQPFSGIEPSFGPSNGQSASGTTGEQTGETGSADGRGETGRKRDTSGQRNGEIDSSGSSTDSEDRTTQTDAASNLGTRDALDGTDGDSGENETDADPAGEGPIAEDSDAHTGSRPLAQQSDPAEQGPFTVPNYTQDMLNFEFVLDSEDSWVPEGVDGAGMVVVDEQKYVAILRVKPRSWSIHTAEKKSQIAETFQSSFLTALDFPLQIVSYPTRFDISDHVERLQSIGEENASAADSDLIDIGRSIYPRWIDDFITKNDMKQRRFYVVAPVSAEMIQQLQASSRGILSEIGNKVPPLKPIAEFFDRSADQDVTRTQCVRELNARLSRIEAGLQRLDVQTERLRDRDEVMSVLYHYYNNQRPVHPDFDPDSTRSYFDPAAASGGDR